MRLVEEDHAVEVFAQPIENLLKAGSLAFAFRRTKRGVSRKENPLGEADRRALPVARLGHDQKFLLAQSRPVALRVLDELVGLRNPDGFASATQPVVENDAGGLAPFTRAGAVAEEEPFAELHGVRIVLARERKIVERFIDDVARGQEFGMRFAADR